ncbi:hypothetical protein KRR40_18455 [Niabella defluvii]|nr:hypothetical protein KRR40_18455 [Niabella sp. I65]
MKPLAEQLMKKYYNDYPGGWHVITRSSTKEEQKRKGYFFGCLWIKTSSASKRFTPTKQFQLCIYRLAESRY